MAVLNMNFYFATCGHIGPTSLLPGLQHHFFLKFDLAGIAGVLWQVCAPLSLVLLEAYQLGEWSKAHIW
jgi:hypothetical protein